MVMTPAFAAAPAGSPYTVCNFDDPSVPVANTKYPFDFLLSPATAANGNRKVRKAVRSVQQILRAENLRDNQGNRVVVDGRYGRQTAQAVRRFQLRQQMIADGTVGPQTWKRLGKKFCWMFH